MRGSPTGELIFENCEVPVENLVGKEGESVSHMLRNLNIERVTIAGISNGLARASHDYSTEYATVRKQFDEPLGKFQMIQKMIADNFSNYQASRTLTLECARLIDTGKDTNIMAASCKLFAAQAATQAGLNAIQILGGYGYTKEYPVERYMRDAKLIEIGAGTNEIMRLIIARESLKKYDPGVSW
jgi:isovaleryl-CoA dehydrogenase